MEIKIKTKKENCIVLDSLLYYYEYNDKLNNDNNKPKSYQKNENFVKFLLTWTQYVVFTRSLRHNM